MLKVRSNIHQQWPIAVSAHTNATLYARGSSINSGTAKLTFRTSMQCGNGPWPLTFIQALPLTRLSWRPASMAADSVSFGSKRRNRSVCSARDLVCGGSCHRVGPGFCSRRKTPDTKKFASAILVSQAQHVLDKSRALDQKDQIFRRRLSLCGETFRALEAVARSVHLDRREHFCCVARVQNDGEVRADRTCPASADASTLKSQCECLPLAAQFLRKTHATK